MKCLNDIKTGECCVIAKVLADTNLRRRFTDIGLIENTEVECVGQSPSGDPKAFLIRGAVIAIRSEDSAKIMVRM